MKRMLSFLALAAVAAVLCMSAPSPSTFDTGIPMEMSVTGLGDARSVQESYARWSAGFEREGGSRSLTLALGWSKALSVEHTLAQGTARVDLADGRVTVEAQGLPADALDVWLVDNLPAPADSVRPESHDRHVYVGRMSTEGATARLAARLGPQAFRDFDVDLVVVAQNDRTPASGGLLVGSPTLFQRMHRREERARLGLRSLAEAVPQAPAAPGAWAHLLRTVQMPVARADHDEGALVAAGRALFFTQTFAGNGRTCGTCHPTSNNLTIDPLFIAGLPAADPLFVAERLPALAAGFENPQLMRQVGLILENLDGFDKPGVMRGVPHIFAMTPTLNPSITDQSTVPPAQRTGWSGDGAPGGGTLRDFSTGAVTQHFTKRLNRQPGVDFRLPTDAELDAMEAFMLSVGRVDDLDLSTLRFRSQVVELGRRIFGNDGADTVAQGKCFRCHDNAGATLAGTTENGNFNTGVESLPSLPSRLLDPARTPFDGGFGRGANAALGGFGDGKFNTPPLVEAADTGPFFHNNAVDTIEAAVAFYSTDAFAQSPSGQFLGPIRLAATETFAVAGLLRALNALENIRQAQEENTRSFSANNIHRARIHLGQSIEETQDALDVLRAAGLQPTAVLRLREALVLLRQAFDEPNKNRRDPLVQQATAKKAAARADILL